MTDHVTLRNVTTADREEVKKLWIECFDDTPEFVQWYYQRYYRDSYGIGVFDGSRLLASAQVIPYRISLREKEIDTGYVVGVDTTKEARHRGYARMLLGECLKKQRMENRPISLLMPFEGQFYYRYGWPFCYFHQQIKVHPSELRCASCSYGTVREADPALERDALAEIYDCFISRYEGAVSRKKENWRNLLEDTALEESQYFLLEGTFGKEAYCICTKIENQWMIREFAWKNADAKAGMLWFLQHWKAEEEVLWLELPEDDALSEQLAVSKTAAVRYPFLMARIVDVKQCLEAFSYPNGNQRMGLKVTDLFAPWNHGVFYLELKNQKMTVTKAKEDMPADAEISIEALSQLVMGFKGADRLVQEGSLKVEGKKSVETLMRLWPEKRTYINEYY